MKRILCFFFFLCFIASSCLGCAANTDSTVAQSAEKSVELSSDLSGERLGSTTGTTSESYAANHYPNAKYSSFTSLSDLMQALKSGRVDYALIDDIDMVNYMRSDSGYRFTLRDLEYHEYCIAIRKDEAELKAKMNALISEYLENGVIDRLKSNWIRYDDTPYVIEDIPAVEDGPTLNVAICTELEPTCFIIDGEIQGYDVQIIKQLAYDMGYKLNFIEMNFSALIAALESNRADIAISGIAYTEERAQKVDFSVSYYQSSTALVEYKADSADGANSSGGFIDSIISGFRKNFIVESRWKLILSGIGITLLLSVCSGVLGMIIGFALCLLKLKNFSFVNALITALTRILQGTPVVVLLMILYYIVFNKTGLDGIAVSIIAFGLNFGAYASEIMLSGINAVDRGQGEAAAAIGFTPSQSFVKIVFPQAARHFLPVLKGEYISLVKMTSVVGYVAVQDLTKVSDIIRSRTYEAFFPLIVTAIIYFALSMGLSSLLGLIEVRIDPKRRPRTLKGVNLK